MHGHIPRGPVIPPQAARHYTQELKRRDAQPASGFHTRGAVHAADEGVEGSVAFFFGSGDGTQKQDLIQKLTNKEAGLMNAQKSLSNISENK